MIRTPILTLLWTLGLVTTGWSQQEAAELIRVDDQLTLPAPESWIPQQPKSKIVHYEFALPAADGSEQRWL